MGIRKITRSDDETASAPSTPRSVVGISSDDETEKSAVTTVVEQGSVPESSLHFDPPPLHFLFSDSRVVRSKLIILVETKEI